MNKIKQILYGCLACILIPIFGKDAGFSPTTPLNTKELPRINGELDVSKIEEIVLKTREDRLAQISECRVLPDLCKVCF